MELDPALTRLLAALDPSELALRDWVTPQLDDAMLDHVAAADYGMHAAEYRYALDALLRGSLPRELSWCPAEVLSLTRSSTVDAARLDRAEARRQHLTRLFCCLVLVRAATNNGGPVNSLTPMVESALALGPDAVAAAARYVAWCRLHEPGDWRTDPTSRPILTLALVVLSTVLPAGRTGELVPGLVAAFVNELGAALAEEYLTWTMRPVRDLLKLIAHGEARRTWVALAGSMLVDGPGQHTDHGVLLARVGQAIRGDLVADVAELRSLLVPGRR